MKPPSSNRPKRCITNEHKCSRALCGAAVLFLHSVCRLTLERKIIVSSHSGPLVPLKEFSSPPNTKRYFDTRYDLYEPTPLDVKRLTQPKPGCYEGRFKQVDDELGVYAGGFMKDYFHLCNCIQFFNTTSRSFIPGRRLQIPGEYAETHQGVAIDETYRWLYIISDQKDGGCSPAIASSFRIHVDTGEVQELPPLPELRYALEVVVIPDLSKTDRKAVHVHAFGGASPLRNLTAVQHWRLILSDDEPDASPSWQELEPVPESGSHGVVFYYEGYIYHGGGCNLDFGVGSERMHECRNSNYLGVGFSSYFPTWPYASLCNIFFMGQYYKAGTLGNELPTCRLQPVKA